MAEFDRPLSESLIETLDPDDFLSAVDLLEHMDISCDDVTNVEDVQKKLRQTLAKTRRSRMDSFKGVTVIKDILESDSITKMKLQCLLGDVDDIIQKLPDKQINGVQKVFPNVLHVVKDTVEQLENTGAVILVAGETGAGKSSLLNLLLGELGDTLLPVTHLSSTSVICEIKYGTQAHLKAWPKDETKPAVQEKLDVRDSTSVLSKFVHQRNQGNSFLFSRVEIFWPCEWLKDGVTIVDSPGIGEDDELTELVKQYVPKASAFIYVINTPNAGGIQPDRLQELLFSHLCLQDDDSETFNPQSTIFVCNKWDQVPPLERSEVKNVIKRKLASIWPGFSDEQVFFFSTKQAAASLQDDILTKDFQFLLEGIRKIIPLALNAKLIPKYQLASKIVERCCVELKSFLMKQVGRFL